MNYWWMNADNSNWDWTKNQGINDIERWDAKGESGRIKKYFRMIKKGDKVVGYNAGNQKAIVALGIIDNGLVEDSNGNSFIKIRKTKDIKPVSIDIIKMISPFDKKFDISIKLNGTAIKLEKHEYDKLMDIISKNILLGPEEDDNDITYILKAEDIASKEEPKKIPDKQNKNGSVWERDPSVSKEALKNAGYTCEIDNMHFTFKSNVTGENFVEAHHLIPMNQQENFKYSLDVRGNIVSLCPVCHKLLHFGQFNDKVNMLKLLYQGRKSILTKYGINITEQQLLDIYK